MAKQKYKLNDNEIILYKVSNVRHGFWGAYTNKLVVTNESVIEERYNLFDFFKGIRRYNYSDIKQAIEGEASNGEKQLELYINDKVEDFACSSRDEQRILIMAINDQMGPDAGKFDNAYYKNIMNDFKETNRLNELRKKAGNNTNNSNNLKIATNAAKNVVKSGNYSLNGIIKGVEKAQRKEKRKGFLKDVLDFTGISDVQDDFTEIGNDFREMVGLKTKMTNAERKELEKLEEKRSKMELEETKSDIIKKRKEELNKKSNDLDSVNEQLEMLKKAKELLDSGVLTKKEFEQKKKEILNQ